MGKTVGVDRRSWRAQAWCTSLVFIALVGEAMATMPLPRRAFDLGDPKNFDQAMKLRVGQDKRARLRVMCKQMNAIIFAFNERSHGNRSDHLGQMWWMSVMQLENRGMTNYIALTDNPGLCENLYRRWPIPDEQQSPIRPSCAWSSQPYKNHSASFLPGDLDNLMALRYHVAAKIAELGVDVLLIDTDTEINDVIWETLNAPPLSAFDLVGLREEGTSLNGGTLFIRGTRAHPQGAALWMVREVERQTLLFREAEFGDPAGPSADPGRGTVQTILGEALRVASNAPASSQWDFRLLYEQSRNKGHPFWEQHLQTDARLGPKLERKMNATSVMSTLPNKTCPSEDPSACERYENFLHTGDFKNHSLIHAGICVPHDSPNYNASVPCERFAFGPPWLWVHGGSGKYGWRTPAVHHMAHVEKFWSQSGEGSHAGQMAWLLARKVIDPRVLTLPMREALLIQVQDDEWEKSFLYNSSAHTKFIIKEFVDQAVALDKIPVFAPISCQAKWLERSDLTESGILDSRVVETPDGKCYPSPGGYDDCMPHVHFMYDFHLEYFDSGLRFADRLESMWETPKASRFSEECKDFTKILE